MGIERSEKNGWMHGLHGIINLEQRERRGLDTLFHTGIMPAWRNSWTRQPGLLPQQEARAHSPRNPEAACLTQEQ